MRLFALTFGGPDSASTHYRLFQYRRLFAATGIQFEHCLASTFRDYSSLKQYDAVLLQKTLLATTKVRQIRKYSKRFLYDADDLIWLSPQKEHHWLTRWRIAARLRQIAKSADLCIAANRVIEADLRESGEKTALIPMSLDGRQWPKPAKRGGAATIGWSGSPKNLPFLRAILPQLLEVQRRFPDVRWAFHCGEDPSLAGLSYRHLPYEPSREPEAVGQFDIGLLPLPDEPFVRGKSPIKALQYFASGAAVAGSPVGATREILEDGANSLWVRDQASWVDILCRLISDPAARLRIAATARQTFDANYDLPVVFERFRRVLTGPP